MFSWDLSRVILKIRCPQDRLEEVAEKMHLKLKNREGAVRRFKVSWLCNQCSSALLHHMSCYAMLCYAMLCYAMLCYAMLCYAMLCYAMLCYALIS